MSSRFYREKDGFATLAVHAGYRPSDCLPYMPIAEPLVTSSTYKQPQPGAFDEFYYSRIGNPNRKNLELRLAALENAEYAATFPSGISTVYAIGSLFEPGDHFVVSTDLYGGTTKCFVGMEKRRGLIIDYVELSTDLNVLESSLRSDSKLLWLESPTNPLMNVVDIQGVCTLAKSIAPDIVIVVDNTFLTPYFQKPLELGATISTYSLTKFMSGHSDVVMGAAVTNCPKLIEGLKMMQEVNGICPSPFDCHQASKGSKTLALRMDQHNQNSLKIAQYLEGSPFVTKVNHPGLESHPSHALAIKQARGHSGIMSFSIRGGLNEVREFVNQLQIVHLATSLGGVETLVASPALMTHDMIAEEKREKMGITDNLIRLSVGIENANDLINDLRQALEAVYQ